MQHGTVILVIRRPVPEGVVEMMTGKRGEFERDLPSGEYIVFFSHPGFRTKIFPVVISPEGEEDLDVFLDVTGTC